ncbi:hypothetical protein ACQY0O_006974 [Thecaphora frezii]
MSHMQIDGQNPAYQGMRHPAVFDVPGPVEVDAKTARRRVGRPSKSSKPQDPIPLASDTVRDEVLGKVHELLQDYSTKHKGGMPEQSLAKVRWVDVERYHDRDMLEERHKALASRLSAEANHWSEKRVSSSWEDLAGHRGWRFDLRNFRIVLVRIKDHRGAMENFRVAGIDRDSGQQWFIGVLQVPGLLKERDFRTPYYNTRSVQP